MAANQSEKAYLASHTRKMHIHTKVLTKKAGQLIRETRINSQKYLVR